MIRVGVVGVGEMGQHHVRIYNEIEDADLVLWGQNKVGFLGY